MDRRTFIAGAAAFYVTATQTVAQSATDITDLFNKYGDSITKRRLAANKLVGNGRLGVWEAAIIKFLDEIIDYANQIEKAAPLSNDAAGLFKAKNHLVNIVKMLDQIQMNASLDPAVHLKLSLARTAVMRAQRAVEERLGKMDADGKLPKTQFDDLRTPSPIVLTPEDRR